jgi:hypothetical protein
MDPWSDNLGH